MAKTFDKITPARFAGLMKTEGRTNDGPGFYLQVSRIKTASGEPGNLTASNLFKFTLGGKRREMGLGKVIRYEDLVKGRERAAAARDLVYDRVDPIEQRRKDRATKLAETPTLMTFEDAFKGFLRDKRREWSNAVHAAQWETTMRDYALPVLGKISVAAIDTQLVLRCIKPIWESRTETAKRVRGRIEAVLSWCTAHKLRSGPNPAEWKNHLSNILAKPSKLVKVKSHPAMDYDDVPGFVAKLVELDTQAARAIRLLILTATRLNELRFARWDEVDLDGRMWVIPAERTKRDREHRVPLSRQAIAIIRSLKRQIASPYLFPGVFTPRKPMAAQSLRELLHGVGGKELTLHGFRASFSSWTAARTNYPTAVREAALGHAEGHAKSDEGNGNTKVAGAYQRSDLIEKRARLMESWSDFISSPPAIKGKVTQLRRRG